MAYLPELMLVGDLGWGCHQAGQVIGAGKYSLPPLISRDRSIGDGALQKLNSESFGVGAGGGRHLKRAYKVWLPHTLPRVSLPSACSELCPLTETVTVSKVRF